MCAEHQPQRVANTLRLGLRPQPRSGKFQRSLRTISTIAVQRTQRKTITWENRQDHLSGENPLSLKFPALHHYLPKSSRTATIFGARNLFRRNVRSDNTRWTIAEPCSLINLPADCRRRAEAALWRAAKAESPRSFGCGSAAL